MSADELRDIRCVKGTDYQVVAYDGEAHVVLLIPPTSWDEPPGDQLMGSVGDLIRALDAALDRLAAIERDLTTLYESLPLGHPEKPGIWRALEVVRLTPMEIER